MIDILDPKNVLNIINDIESTQNTERRKYEYKQFLCYSGRLSEFVQEKLSVMLPKDSKWMDPVDIRVSKKIVDKLSKAYAIPPKRYIAGNDGERQDVKSEKQNQIYKDGKFDSAFSRFDLATNLHKYSALWVTKREGKPISLEAVPASSIHPIFDQDTGDLIAVVLNYPGRDITHAHSVGHGNDDKLGRGNTSFYGSDGINQIIAESPDDSNISGKTYAMWTPTQHAVYEVEKTTTPDGKTNTQIKYIKQTDDENLNGVNDLGVIPFAFYSIEGGVELPIENPITKQTVFINCLLSALVAASIRNIGTAKLRHPEDMKVEFMEQGLSTFVDLPQPKNPDDGEVDLTYEVPSHDLNGQLTVALSIMMQVFSEHGIKAADAIAGQSVQEFASGIERAIAQADVTDHIRKMQMQYEQEVESSVWEIVKAYLRRDGDSSFSEEDAISVVYPKPKVLVSDKDTLDLLKQRKEMKLISRSGQMQVLDPNLTKSELEKALEKIDEENAEDSAKGMAMFRMPGAVDDQDSEDPRGNVQGRPGDLPESIRRN